MVKEIVHDPIFLGVKSDPATKEDVQIAKDLLDTLVAHKDGCVGITLIGEYSGLPQTFVVLCCTAKEVLIWRE